MAKLRKLGAVVDVAVELVLNEDELCALDALFGYDLDAFLKTFYAMMGRHYLEPHEAGLRSLAATLRGCAGLSGEARECREFLRLAADARTKALREARGR
jgi:hypothetical protein